MSLVTDIFPSLRAFTKRRRIWSHTVFTTALLICALCAISLSAWSQKTDTVFLEDGSILIGEVKSMRFNSLQFKTHSMSTINIKWYHVSSLIARDKVFAVDIKYAATREEVVYGSIDSSSRNGYLEVNTLEGPQLFHRTQISSIVQVKQSFWGKFSGNIGIGLSYTKSSNIWDLNYSGGLTYQSKKFFSQFTFNSIRTTQQDTITTINENYSLNSFWNLKHSWLIVNYLGANRNTQLGIDRRLYVGGGVARILLTSRNLRLLGSAGVIRTWERRTNNDDTNSYEGTFQLDFRVFKNLSPEISLTTIGRYYPSLTEAGRHRLEYDLDFNVEVVNNLYVGGTFYFSYDSKTADGALSNGDLGFTTKLSYKFGL